MRLVTFPIKLVDCWEFNIECSLKYQTQSRWLCFYFECVILISMLFLPIFPISITLYHFFFPVEMTTNKKLILFSVLHVACVFPPCCIPTWLFSSVKMKLFQNLFSCHLSKNVMECKCTSTDLLEIQFSSVLTSCFFCILHAFQLSIFIDEAINSQNILNLFHDLTHILKKLQYTVLSIQLAYCIQIYLISEITG